MFAAAWRSPNGSWRIVEPATPFFTPARLRMLAALALAAAVILPAALWGAARLTAPFRRLEAAAADDERLDSAAWVGGPSEARSAASAMDAMRQRLLDHLRTRTAMMAAIAHDLRTPLTGLRLRVEGLTGAAKAEAVADIARMERMIAQLLTYVRGEEAPWVTEPVDLVDVIEDALRRHRLAGSPVSLEAEGEHLVLADREHLDRALSNLIDNAVLYGGGARIAVHARDGITICTIADDGPGIAPDELNRVFEPFHRLETSRNRHTGGAGLGLAIVASILRRAGGEINLRNRPEGGLCAEVRLPALAAV
ncbi:sensor histidine kinase [Brevundimonas vesicularis]|uniref:sensor histidine kinase n=1 Tax=Brevundimonas vesicularis TaxID=41276 RepID=UPI0027D8DB42|nr:HAMP domain-containing sensor histidine kinase [Brevundimonas vesicularis]